MKGKFVKPALVAASMLFSSGAAMAEPVDVEKIANCMATETEKVQKDYASGKVPSLQPAMEKCGFNNPNLTTEDNLKVLSRMMALRKAPKI